MIIGNYWVLGTLGELDKGAYPRTQNPQIPKLRTLCP